LAGQLSAVTLLSSATSTKPCNGPGFVQALECVSRATSWEGCPRYLIAFDPAELGLLRVEAVCMICLWSAVEHDLCLLLCFFFVYNIAGGAPCCQGLYLSAFAGMRHSIGSALGFHAMFWSVGTMLWVDESSMGFNFR
jgi:hypothetical protein